MAMMTAANTPPVHARALLDGRLTRVCFSRSSRPWAQRPASRARLAMRGWAARALRTAASKRLLIGEGIDGLATAVHGRPCVDRRSFPRWAPATERGKRASVPAVRGTRVAVGMANPIVNALWLSLSHALKTRGGSKLSKTVLTIEESGDVRLMLHRALTDAGFQVVHAMDGEQGLDLLQADDSRVDIIITDIDLPRLDGVGFIETVRRNGRHQQTPILVLADDHDALRKNLARRAGASGWMLKPFNPVKLIDAIHRVAA